MITEVSRIRAECFIKFAIVLEELVFFILNRNQARYKLKQVLVFIPLPVQLSLLFTYLRAHLVNCGGQLSHFIFLIDNYLDGIISLSYKPRPFYQPFYGTIYKSKHKNKYNRGGQKKNKYIKGNDSFFKIIYLLIGFLKGNNKIECSQNFFILRVNMAAG